MMQVRTLILKTFGKFASHRHTIDRILGIRRIPPTAWTALPINWIRAAAALMSGFYCQCPGPICFVINHPLLSTDHHLVSCDLLALPTDPPPLVRGLLSVFVKRHKNVNRCEQQKILCDSV